MKTNGTAAIQEEPDASAPNTSTALARTQDRDVMRQRRELIVRLFIDERLTLERIVERLAKRKPPIIVSRWTVRRDLDFMRRENRRLFDPRRFDAISFVLEKVAVYESLVRKCVRDAHHTRDTRARILAYRAAAEINERITNLLADAGFIDRQIGRLVFVDDSIKADRPLTGTELQRRFPSVGVADAELVSEAEKASLSTETSRPEIGSSGMRRAGSLVRRRTATGQPEGGRG